jgi:UDP-N-acetylenolpyruvoylglucosamine reductase
MNLTPLPPLFGRAVRRIHCVGVGGTGVAPLAIYLAQVGFAVTGEDRDLSPGVRLQLEHAGVVPGPLPAACDLLVHSSAVPVDHPACIAARARGLPLVRRGELLAAVLHGKKLVAVCGSHGKTTTTAMLITALRAAGFPAGHVLGGFFADEALAPAAPGANDWVVAEVDESDGTIACFAPEITVVVNLDWDHPDHYHQPAEFEQAFVALAARTRGPMLVNAACASSRRLLPAALSFGGAGNFTATIVEEGGGLMRLRLGGTFAATTVNVRAHGDYNAANATAALAAVQLMGAALAPELLGGYAGVRRRQTVLHDGDGLTVIEDYAHHPAEIRALLAGLRPQVGAGGRLVVVFQPHRFSRTAQFKGAFAEVLTLADRIHLLDVYPAGEAPVPGGTSADLCAELKKNAITRPVDCHSGIDAPLFHTLCRETRSGDLVVFVGAGDIDRKARAWLATRREDAGQADHWDGIATAMAQGLGPDSKVRREEPLGPRTTMRVGGAARIFAEPAGSADLQALLRGAAARGVAVHLLGRGSNLIVPDEGVDGLVIALTHESWAKFELREGGRVWAGAGLRLKNLCGLTAKAGLTGFEFLEGIPGNIGGALRMNAGAMGGWIFDVVEEVQLMTLDGEVRTLAKSAMHVHYRLCAELQHAIALGALLRPVAPGASAAVARQIDVYRRKRQESQPREPSAGCIFKNPPGDSAGRLIDGCGLKGERVGDAEVSRVHANFIINRGSASAADVLELVRRIRARVRETAGVTLEPEVLLYGKKWEDVL